jgi:hypothetical protein
MDHDHLLHAASLPSLGQRAALRVLHLFGWRIRVRPLPGPHGIAVVYPHTSNLDFFIGLLCKWALGIPFRWLAKESLFKGPTGALMRYWGGLPVERRGAPTGATQRLADRIHSADWMWIVITPEGSRARQPHWKSGFYHLALAARVPLLLIALDFGKKEVRFVDHLQLTGDQDVDMAALAASYQGATGLYPDQAGPITLAPARAPDAPERRRA